MMPSQLEIKYLDTKVDDLEALISSASNISFNNRSQSSTSSTGLLDQICSCISGVSVEAAGHAGLKTYGNPFVCAACIEDHVK